MFNLFFPIVQFQSLITAETDAIRPLLLRAKIAGGIPLPMNRPGLMVLKSPDRASSGREGASMMEGAGQLAGAATVTFFRKSANLHFGFNCGDGWPSRQNKFIISRSNRSSSDLLAQV
jgi:hypothetical protein